MPYFNIIGMFTLRFLSLDSAGLLDHYLRTDFLDINFLDNFRWTLFDFFVRISIKNYQLIPESARWWLCLNFSLKIVPFYCDWLMLIAFVCPKSRIKMPFSHSVRFLKLFNCSQSMECWKCGLIALYATIYTTTAFIFPATTASIFNLNTFYRRFWKD